MTSAKSFTVVVGAGARGGVVIPVPIDADRVWGKKPRHHVHGRVGFCDVRGPLTRIGKSYALVLGPAWCRNRWVKAGDKVRVTLAPEGPQRDVLAADIAAALEAEPKAAAFFDGLAQFYRKAYLRWIDATKRRPEERVRRIAETVRLLKRGIKQRPQ